MMRQGREIVDKKVDRIDTALRHDDRCKALADGLRQLPSLTKLYSHIASGAELVLDEIHYDANAGLWCPLAVGLGLPEVIEREQMDTSRLSERRARGLILAIGAESVQGFSLNPVS